jgi:serine/threonine protein kinase/Tol biopolymer transport system component
MIGETVRHYRILGRLGAGGMGVVYRARDERLGREVAVKVLPEALVTDPERLRRLEAEARAMATVDHPNVATIYAVEEHEGRVLLVLELVKGTPLVERLKRGPLPEGEALELARQVAAGLEAAHRRGIVHRDLKPSNVMVGPKGQVKILDFGLAKALERPDAVAPDLSRSPTLPVEAATESGVILGTLPYLSPEQARGLRVDERTDVWAFGCLVYEMLTGRRAFSGETPTDTIAAVVSRDPNWDALPPGTPEMVIWLLDRCLRKDADERLRAIGDARFLLEGHGKPKATVPAGLERSPSRLPWVVAVVAAGIVGFWLSRAGPVGPQREASTIHRSVVRFSLFADPDNRGVSFAPSWKLSPDDRLFAFQTVPRPGAAPSAIRLRSLADGTVRELAGTEGALESTFSPDGEHIAYFQEKQLRRISVRNGTIESIARLDYEHWVGLTWTDEGFLAITSWIPRGLWRVDASGGALEELRLHDPEILEPGTNDAPFFPNDLPGGRFLLVTHRRLPSDDQVELLSLDDGERRIVAAAGTRGTFVPPRFVVYYHQGKLFAVPFDVDDGRVEGEPVVVIDGVRRGLFSVSRSGSLAYVSASDREPEGGSLAVARPGAEPETLAVGTRGAIIPRVSPDGRRVVFSTNAGSPRANLWLYDLDRETARRLTGEEGNEWWSDWGADGRLAFQSDREDGRFLDLYVMDPDRPGSTRKVLDSGDCYLQPQAWSPDGLLLYQRSCPASGTLDIFTLEVDSGEALPLRQTEAREKHPSISPDGRWLAFASNLSGEDQVYLTTYPEPGRLIQVSPAGGDGPMWTPSGDGLFFHAGGDLLFVPFDGEAARPLGTPEIAVRGVPGNSYVGRGYDLFPDGRILLRLSAPVRQVQVVLAWNQEVARKLGTGPAGPSTRPGS